MGTVPPRIIPPLGRVAPLETIATQKKLPLCKCMQCHEVKREVMSSGRCQACYDANEQRWQEQRARDGIAVDENLIGWMYLDTHPGLNDYLLRFLLQLRPSIKMALFFVFAHEQWQHIRVMERLGKRLYEERLPKDEPLSPGRGEIVPMECEVRYE